MGTDAEVVPLDPNPNRIQTPDCAPYTGCGTGCDRAGQLVCGVWCCSQAAAIHFFIVRAGRVFALNWSDECAGDVM